MLAEALVTAHNTGEHDDARLVLAAAYGWVTEGFDTIDRQEANALLAVLQREATLDGALLGGLCDVLSDHPAFR